MSSRISIQHVQRPPELSRFEPRRRLSPLPRLGELPRASWRAVGRALGTVVLTLPGELDRPTSAQLAEVLADLIDGQGNLAVVIDLEDLRRVDPAGLIVLTDAVRALEGQGGQLRLSGPSREVHDALTLAGLARLIDI